MWGDEKKVVVVIIIVITVIIIVIITVSAMTIMPGITVFDSRNMSKYDVEIIIQRTREIAASGQTPAPPIEGGKSGLPGAPQWGFPDRRTR